MLRIATVNVGTMVGRSREVVEMLEKRGVDICSVQEVRYKGQGARMMEGEQRYKLWWSGGKDSRSGVGVLLREELMKNVIEVKRTNDRLMQVKMVWGKKIAHFFSVYAPQQGRPEEEKQQFREQLEDEISGIPATDILIISGDLNAHIGQRREGFEDEMGIYGFGERNGEGEELLGLCQANNLRIVNTWFKKKAEHLITYKSGDVATQIDYILMRKSEVVKVKNCKVIPGEACITQHRLLCADLCVRHMKRPKMKNGEKRIKVWKLKDEQTRRHFEERLTERVEERGSLEEAEQCSNRGCKRGMWRIYRKETT